MPCDVLGYAGGALIGVRATLALMRRFG
jgi:hypothetical protein